VFSARRKCGVVLRGEHLARLPHPALPHLAFSAEEGTVLVWVEFETAPELVLGEPLEVAAEGEALLF
jgi:hypothetical protein